jgi:aspartyl-tRNA(Asn)/glutamyl-tRNA(Gln) amidotransferase subunit A
MTTTVRQLAARFRRCETTVLANTRETLARIADPAGEGRRAFTRVHEGAALAAAQRADEQQQRRAATSALCGIPVSVKDLFDMEGEPTSAGSLVLQSARPATRDAAVVHRLRAAGAVIVGRTNMTEFAYSGLGLNPHFGTPLNPWDRRHRRVPGGSSSGAAVSVSDGMALAAVATDTGGSARIPAAFCGLTGFKPTASRISRDGVLPLSPTLDSVGAIGATVDCCALLDAAMARSALQLPAGRDDSTIRLGAVSDYVLDGVDSHVARTYERALAMLSRLGVRVEEVRFPELSELPGYNGKGGFAAYESYRFHAPGIARHGASYDPRVLSRIQRGKDLTDEDRALLQAQRARFITRTAQRFAGFDALVMPTVPIVAPTQAECEAEDDYTRLNLLVLRNPSIVNFMDGCAISLPCHAAGEAPVGLSLFQTAHRDAALLALARTVERLLASQDLGALAR